MTIVEDTQEELWSAKDMLDVKLFDKDDDSFGTVEDLLFDDDHWTVRYLVVKSGPVFKRSQVLVSPFLLNNPEFTSFNPAIHTQLTKEQLSSCPPLEEHKPISRRYEEELAGHFTYPSYWAGPLLWGTVSFPVPHNAVPDNYEISGEIEKTHLRSINEIIGYQVSCSNDEELGTVEDFFIDTETWEIVNLVVYTGEWFDGGMFSISPQLITGISWQDRLIDFGNTDRAAIESR
ncbi:MAG: PRC-barrel domain-containing protein [Verrucomicrobiales bacterium]|nr:PRC-barrel domain-containing protein [Verrucomicrobiales bacterium]